MDRDDADEALVRAAREGGGDDEVAARLHALREELRAPVPDQARWNHLAAMRRAADPTVVLPVDPTAELPVEATVAVATSRPRGRVVVLVAAATVGVLGLTGGLAAAGRLPRPAQDRVARFAEVVGIDLPDHDDTRDVGPGNGREIIRPRTTTPAAGATGTAPPAGPRGPGAAGTLPGASGSAPGHSQTGPGGSENAPGHTKDPTGTTTPPGSSGNAPGQSGEQPGNEPGQSGSNGNSGNAPGQSGSTGNSGNAPGHN